MSVYTINKTVYILKSFRFMSKYCQWLMIVKNIASSEC